MDASFGDWLRKKQVISVYFSVMRSTFQQSEGISEGAGAIRRVLDARVKIVLLLSYAISLFFVSSFEGMAIAALAFFAAYLASGVEASKVFLLPAFVYLLVGFMLISSSLVLSGTANAQGAIPLFGSVVLLPDALSRSCLAGARIVLLVWMTLTTAFSVTAAEAVDAVRGFAEPFSRMDVDTADAVMTLSVAVRFVPIMASEFDRVRKAQRSRGGLGEKGGVASRLRGWAAVLAPMLVGLFRRADALGEAMDARCYGAMRRRTSLRETRMGAISWAALATGLAACLALAVLF